MTTGQQYASIDVRVYDDWMPEANEKFRLKLKKAVNAMIGTEDKTVVQIVNLHEGKANCLHTDKENQSFDRCSI